MKAEVWIILGIIAYAIFMVSHGFSNFKQTSKSAESFFNADRGVSSFVLVCTTSISIYSGLSYYGYPSATYVGGIGYVAAAGCAVTGLFFCLIGYRLWILGKEYGFQTPADYLRVRYYSEGFGLFVAILLVVFIVPYVAVQLMTIGSGIVVTTKGMFPYIPAVLLGTICVSLHIIGGGMKSVAWLDTFHAMLGLGAVYIVVIYLVYRFFPNGGLIEATSIVASNPDTAAVLSTPGPSGEYDWKGILNMALTAAVASIVWPHVFMRCYIAKGIKNFRVMSWALPIAYLLPVFGLVVVGTQIGPAIYGANFADPDNLLPTLVTDYCPSVIAFISLLCLFAFAVSTADSLLLSASALASRDIYIRHFYELKGKSADSKQAVYFGRVVLVILMVACIIITATKSTYIVDYAYKLSSPFFAMILPCSLGGIFWKKGTKEGAIAGTVAGVIVTFIFTFIITPPMGFSALLWGLAVNFALYIGVSLCTKVPEEIVEKYIVRVDEIIANKKAEEKIAKAEKAAAKTARKFGPIASAERTEV